MWQCSPTVSRAGSVWNCLWGLAYPQALIWELVIRLYGDMHLKDRKSRVLYPGPGFLSSTTCPSLPNKHYTGLNVSNMFFLCWCPYSPSRITRNLMVDRGDMDISVKKNYPSHFQKAWKDDPEFSPWLREVAGVCLPESGRDIFILFHGVLHVATTFRFRAMWRRVSPWAKEKHVAYCTW